MFNIGGGELIVILLIALIVLGPQRLPDAARQLGKAMGDLRRLSTGFQNEMKQALETADDPARVAARRNVLGAEPSPSSAPDEPADADAAAGSIAAVSAQPSVPTEPPVAPARARSSSKKAAQAPRVANAKPRPAGTTIGDGPPAARPVDPTRAATAGESTEAEPRPADG